MRILFFGDTFGKSGRSAVIKAIDAFSKKTKFDFVIVNGENMAHGRGITPEIATAMFDAGVDAITLGNHAWDQKQILSFIEAEPRLIRPANFPSGMKGEAPGKGSLILESKISGEKLGLFQLMGRVFMDPFDCPFQKADQIISEFKDQGIGHLFLDMHAEASSEKIAMAHYVDGRVSAVVGTHWHVQTSDERLLSNGTAAITDVGLCGVFDSVIGAKKEVAIQKFLTKMPTRFEPAEGVGGVSAVVIDIDSEGKAQKIQRIRIEQVTADTLLEVKFK